MRWSRHVLAGIGEPPVDLDAHRPAALPRLGNTGQWRIAIRGSSRTPRCIASTCPRAWPSSRRILRHFHAALPDDRLAAQTFRIFGYYVIGAALDETAGYAAGPSSAAPVTDDYIARECPHLATSAPYFKQAYFESTFELGFEMLLKGIADLRAGHAGQPRRRAPKPVVRPKA